MSVQVWRAWDHEWVAECTEHGEEIQWGGRWMDAMEAAWGHIAMHHASPKRPKVMPIERLAKYPDLSC